RPRRGHRGAPPDRRAGARWRTPPTRCRPRVRVGPTRLSGGSGSASGKLVCAAQESSSVLVPLCIDPVRRRAFQLGGIVARDRQGRQIPVEADEPKLREDLNQPGRQTCRSTVRTVSAKQVLELLAGHLPPEPEAPVEGRE